MTITIIEIQELDILDVLTVALETNAIGYWAQYQEWERHETDENDPMYSLVTSMIVKELNEEETDYETPHKIDREVVIKGIMNIVTGEVPSVSTKEMIIENDIDSEGADFIIQAGLFGEIKYG